MQPKVSVLVPVYNVAKYLPECLDSAVNQSLREIEFICVNDGSTDESLSILRDYESKYPTIKVIDKENGGYGIGMNTAMDAATGEYIGILESDDFASRDMFEVLYTIAKAADADAVKSQYFTYVSYPEPSENKVNSLAGCTFGQVFCPREHQAIFFAPPSIWSGLYRREFLIKNDIRFTETPGASFQDTGFNFKVWASAERAVAISDAFLHYRVDNEGSSVKSREKVFFVNREYAEMLSFLNRNPHLKEPLLPLLNGMKYKTYMWNIKRLDPTLRYEYYQAIVKEFKQTKTAGEIVKEAFDKNDYKEICQLLEDPEAYYSKTFRHPKPKHTILVYCDEVGTGLAKTLISIARQNEKSYEVFVQSPFFSRDINICIEKYAVDNIAFKTIAGSECFADALDTSLANGSYITIMHASQMLQKDALKKIESSCSEGLVVYGVLDGEDSPTVKSSEDVLREYYSGAIELLPLIAGKASVFEGKSLSFLHEQCGAMLFDSIELHACSLLKPLKEGARFGIANKRRPLPQTKLFTKYYDELKATRKALLDKASELNMNDEAFALFVRKNSWINDYYASLPDTTRTTLGEDYDPERLFPVVLQKQLNQTNFEEGPSVTVLIADDDNVDSPLETIRTALGQTLKHIEVIYVGNVTHTDYVDELSAIASSDSRFSFLITSEKRGKICAFNIGMKYAHGSYLSFLGTASRFAQKAALESMIRPAIDLGSLIVAGKPSFDNPISAMAIRFLRSDINTNYEANRLVRFDDFQCILGISRFLFDSRLFDKSSTHFKEYSCLGTLLVTLEAMVKARELALVPNNVIAYADNNDMFPKFLTEMQCQDALLSITDILDISYQEELPILHSKAYQLLKEDLHPFIHTCSEYNSVWNALLVANNSLVPSMLDNSDIVHKQEQIIPVLAQAPDSIAASRNNYTRLHLSYKKIESLKAEKERALSRLEKQRPNQKHKKIAAIIKKALHSPKRHSEKQVP